MVCDLDKCLRAGEAPAKFRRIVAAVARSRADLAQRPKKGGVYAKMMAELSSPHVLLWKPRRPIESPQNFRGRPVSWNVARKAAMARARIQGFVPRFLVALLELADCAATRLYKEHPEYFEECGNFLIMPNPAYFELQSRKGFSLVAWWIHPELKKRSRFFVRHADLPVRLTPSPGPDQSADRGPAVFIGDILDRAADAAPYLYDDSDLTADHWFDLQRLDACVRAHVVRVYGRRVTDLYFHRQHAMWNSPQRAWSMTLHLHVCVGRARTPACYCHSVTLSDVLDKLKPSSPTSVVLYDDDDAFEILNIPDDPDEARAACRLLANSGFHISRALTPRDLAFEDLLVFEP